MPFYKCLVDTSRGEGSMALSNQTRGNNAAADPLWAVVPDTAKSAELLPMSDLNIGDLPLIEVKFVYGGGGGTTVIVIVPAPDIYEAFNVATFGYEGAIPQRFSFFSFGIVKE